MIYTDDYFEKRKEYSHRTAKKNWHALKPYIRRGDRRFLDVGCGKGDLVRMLLAKNLTAVGVDIVPHEHSIVASATELPFEDHSFDVIIASDVLEHLTEHENEIAYYELFRVAPTVIVRIGTKPEEGHLTLHPKLWWKNKYPKYTYL